MKDQINTIREALNLIDHNEWEQRDAALTALAQLEAMVGEQEPVAVVKYQVGGLAVHIVGDVQEGDELFKTPQQAEAVPPPNCSQRLAREGKLHPRSSCAVCGPLSPKWQKCNLALALEGANK